MPSPNERIEEISHVAMRGGGGREGRNVRRQGKIVEMLLNKLSLSTDSKLSSVRVFSQPREGLL